MYIRTHTHTLAGETLKFEFSDKYELSAESITIAKCREMQFLIYLFKMI